MIADILQDQLVSFGARLKKLRRERNWTLDDLAGHSGLSKSYLSRLESGDRQASIAAVLTLSRLFGVSMAALFDDEPDAPLVIVRRGERAPHSADGLTTWPLSAGARPFQIQPMRVVVARSRPGDRHHRHDGEEWIFVLAGALTLSVDGRKHDLEIGDAAHFDARQPHRLSARGGADAEILLVAAPGNPTLSVKTPRSDSSRIRHQPPHKERHHEPGNHINLGVP
jgi:transcriptional regulator with XRE-family HTH domain